MYYVQHVEKNSSLADRVDTFLEQAEKAAAKTAMPIDAVPIQEPKLPPAAKKKKT